MAVTASTTTTLIVFLPLVLGAGTELTTWLKEVGLTISIALACSLFSSLTLIPLMSAHLLKVKANGRNRTVEWLEERYVRVLGWTLKHRIKTFGLLIVGLMVGFLPFFAGWVDSAIFSGTVNSRLYLAYEFDDFSLQESVGRRGGGDRGLSRGQCRGVHGRHRLLLLHRERGRDHHQPSPART